MNRIDRKVELMKKLQREMDHRTKIEAEAIRLIGECEFEKARALLDTLDDEIVRQIERELDESHDENESEKSEGDVSYEKQFEYRAEKGSRVEIKIEAKIKDLNNGDLEEILHEYASRTHNFYLSLGRKLLMVINNLPFRNCVPSE